MYTLIYNSKQKLLRKTYFEKMVNVDYDSRPEFFIMSSAEHTGSSNSLQVSVRILKL